MTTRSNPFYQYRDPNLGNMFNGIAGVMAAPAQSERDAASAMQSQALANKYGAETAGIRSKNDAMNTAPAMLAELFRSGGVVTDDPFTRNPNYVPPSDEPTDFSLTAPAPTMPEPYFNAGRSADEKMGMAMQEALMRGIKIDDIAKIFAQGAFLNNANAGTPEAGMGFMPLFGSAPTTSTALSTGRQDDMSARDADEARRLAELVARMQGVNSANVANINQDAQNVRNLINNQNAGARGAQPSAVPNVTPAIIKGMTNVVNERLQGLGFRNVDPRVVDGLVSVASQRYQDPNAIAAFKNPAAAVDAVLNEIKDGTLPGFESATQPGGFFSRESKSLSRTAPASAPTQDPLAGARAAIAQGAPREAVIKRLRDNGIDPRGL